MLMSDRYQVNYLKTQYEELVTKLTPEKSLMAYDFAHQHKAKHLFGAALSRITENMEEIIKSAGYMELVNKDPSLVVEIYEAYMSKQQNSGAGESMDSIRPEEVTWIIEWGFSGGDQFFQLSPRVP
ncbi:unnamed protein product [Microthlaspi erraticum]|uniref:Uncharacterized protein n=1 Tax=Microthlaspi erraticum TaxID=1685480 RepID=A0A6D2KZ07_9BRAS|nr:unnamed protein product [Microthlaspi erraticum]